ncbi:hypothetical protein [Bacillus arachidis]|uniref:hypothetical protein n=1 Tax=Bacillus arachidis TaxID=2819290 RepID=UPI00255C9BEC|nr:hypothetical protein [Bacillus arachidis]WIY62442.1 hypothetical protein QRY57_08075 [Bacillus arachidis]
MDYKKNDDEEVIKEKAKQIAIQYFKEDKNLEITVTDFQFAPSDFGVVFVYGYVASNKTRRVSADRNYRDNYKVESIGYDKNQEKNK